MKPGAAPAWAAVVVLLAGALVAHPTIVAPIPLVAAFAALSLLCVVGAVFVGWWGFITAALALYVAAYSLALALGPDRLDLLAPLVAAGWALVFETTDVVMALRAGTTIHRRALLGRTGDAAGAVALAIGGGLLVLAADAAVGVQSPAAIIVAAVAALAALGYVVLQTYRTTSGPRALHSRRAR